MIKMIDIRKEYQMGETIVHALDGVNIDIADHEFVSIIGPSGSGKSTLMNIIGCLDIADAGTYLLDGQEINDYTEDELADQGMRAGKRNKLSEEVLAMVGLAERMDHKPSELSGGQQQRVAIARALVTRPALILADEPTGNLDSHTGREIMQLLHDLNDAGHSIVLITHDAKIAKQTPRMIPIHDGKVQEQDDDDYMEVI